MGQLEAVKFAAPYLFEVPDDEPELKKTWEQVALALFIAIPFAAVAAAIPVASGWGLSWRDAVIALAMYAITGHGVTVGFHRHFTHHAFKAPGWLRAVLAICGMMAVEGPVIRRLSRAFPTWVVLSMLLPPLVGGLWSWSWQGALTAFFWGSLVRVAVVHHVTFAINSVCHITGRAPFKTKDESRNVWWLALPSMGESWHNFHHAEPTSARHGVGRFEIDTSANVIRTLERLRWVRDVRWPDATIIARHRLPVVG